MKKKVITGLLALTMAAGTLAGCGSTASSGNSSAGGTETASASGGDEGKVINIYSWNDEFRERLEAVYPEVEETSKDGTVTTLKDGTEIHWIINPNQDGVYQQKLDEALLKQADASADDKIDIFLSETDYVFKYTDKDADVAMPLKDLGIDPDKDLADQYDFTRTTASDSDGVQRGSTWQCCPGLLVYRRDIAKDVFDAVLNFKYPKTVHLRGYSGRYIGQEDHVTRAVEALAAARKPLLLAGGGVILSNTSEYLRSFVEKTQIPVITTLMGKGAVPDSYANHLGMVGMHGSYAANMAVMECDLLMAIGSRFDDRVTGDAENFAPNAQIVHFDIDKVEINKIVHADISVGGDLRWSLPLLANQVQQGRTPYKKQYQEWRNHVLSLKKDHPFSCRHLVNQIAPDVLIQKLNQQLDDDAIVVTDVGQHQMWAAQFYHTENPRHFITSGGLGTMGYGLPAAMGARLACPDKTVLLLSGDGSIMMNCQEFATLADNGIAVKTVVLCNGVLGMVNQWQRMFYHRRYAASLLKKDNRITAIAEAMGVPGFTATTPDELDEAIEKFLSVPGPALLEVAIPADENVYPMVPGGKGLNEMILEGGNRT